MEEPPKSNENTAQPPAKTEPIVCEAPKLERGPEITCRDKDGDFTIYCSGLNLNTSEAELKKLVAQYGNLKAVIMYKPKGIFGGVAFIKMENRAQALSVMKHLSHTMFNGTYIKMRYADERKIDRRLPPPRAVPPKRYDNYDRGYPPSRYDDYDRGYPPSRYDDYDRGYPPSRYDDYDRGYPPPRYDDYDRSRAPPPPPRFDDRRYYY